MAQVSFGTVLREARERKGYDVQSAARRLRIRPDILRAIENNDFSRLPARGYTRNMVNAYAKLVGLNPADITRMYLDDAYAYQVGRTRGESESPAHVSGRRSVSHHEARQASARQRDGQRSEREGQRSSSARRRSEQGQPSETRRRRNQQEQRGYREPLASRAARAEQESRRGVHVGGAVTTQFTNFYSGSQNMGRNNNQTRLPYVIVAAVILVLLVVIIAMAFGNKGGAASQEVAKVPITGVTDTSADGSGTSDSNSTSDNNSNASSNVTVPTSVKVEYKLASGQQAYVVITQDGQATQQMLTGPVDETVDVSGTWSLASWVSSGFTVTMDGKTVDFTNDATTGMPTATVNFKDYLTQWASDHPNVKVDGLTSSDNGASSTTNSGTTTTSTSGSTTGNTASGTSTQSTSSTSNSVNTGGTASTTSSSAGTGSGTSSTSGGTSAYSSTGY